MHNWTPQNGRLHRSNVLGRGVQLGADQDIVYGEVASSCGSLTQFALPGDSLGLTSGPILTSSHTTPSWTVTDDIFYTQGDRGDVDVNPDDLLRCDFIGFDGPMITEAGPAATQGARANYRTQEAVPLSTLNSAAEIAQTIMQGQKISITGNKRRSQFIVLSMNPNARIHEIPQRPNRDREPSIMYIAEDMVIGHFYQGRWIAVFTLFRNRELQFVARFVDENQSELVVHFGAPKNTLRQAIKSLFLVNNIEYKPSAYNSLSARDFGFGTEAMNTIVQMICNANSRAMYEEMEIKANPVPEFVKQLQISMHQAPSEEHLQALIEKETTLSGNNKRQPSKRSAPTAKKRKFTQSDHVKRSGPSEDDDNDNCAAMGAVMTLPSSVLSFDDYKIATPKAVSPSDAASMHYTTACMVEPVPHALSRSSSEIEQCAWYDNVASVFNGIEFHQSLNSEIELLVGGDPI